MSVESSKNPAPAPAFHPSGCPRCAVKLERPYKYCPNCSYRLRPDLTRHRRTEAEPIRQSQRLLAIGGYLGFVSLLLLLVLTGLRLFEGRSSPPVEPLRRIKIAVATVRFDESNLHEVPYGEVSWGVYRPVDSTGVLRDLLRRMPALSEEDDHPSHPEFEEWLARTRSVLEERTRADLPDLYRVDDTFRIGTAEITNEQWYAFLHARAKKSGRPAPTDYYPRAWRRSSPHRLVPRLYPAAASGKPISDVSFVAALEFCNWVWEELLGADPDLIVDLPTPLEFARAGRGDSLDNFPWGLVLGDEEVVLSGQPLPVRQLGDGDDEPGVGFYRGLYAQVGNVSEWIHFKVGGCAAAGWSYLEAAPRYASVRSEWTSPFSSEAVEEYPALSNRAAHIGFRIVIRRAPSMPRFVPVTAGPVRFVSRDNPVMPPEMETFNEFTGEFSTQRPPSIAMPTGTATVRRDFAMAANEITNRQYLAFVVEQAAELVAGDESGDAPEERDAKEEELRKRRLALLPGGFRSRPHPFRGQGRLVFTGSFGNGDVVPRLYEAGRETQPVQGVNPDQAQAYASWLSRKLGATVRLPTAAEYVRAGRGDGISPYPWGTSVGKPELICAGRADDQDRARSLYSFLRERPDGILGLCGNVLELVESPPGVIQQENAADPSAETWLLAGGSYEFEADGCTLDSFLDHGWIWGEVERESTPDEDESEENGGPHVVRIPLAPLTGFRVVREAAHR